MSDAPLPDSDLLDTLLDLVSEDEDQAAPTLRPVRLARVRHEGRPWLFHTVRVPDAARVHKGDRVIFEVPGDSAFGELIDEPALRMPETDPAALPTLKALTADEVAQIAEKVSRREAEAFTLFRERIQALRLPMKPVHIEMSALSGRVVFYFWSDTRVDFRNLLQDLRKRVQGTIELTQVGSHEAARQIGGIGRCHREFCSRVLPSYPPVSPKHARTQGLSPNPQKHMGACGRLMGCLAYEQEQYAEARKGLPKEGKSVETPLGKAVIKELDILRGRVRVRTEDGQWETFHVSELKRDGKPLVAAAEPETVDTMDADADELLDFELAGRPLDGPGDGESDHAADASPLARAAAAAPRPAAAAPRAANRPAQAPRVAQLMRGGGEARAPQEPRKPEARGESQPQPRRGDGPKPQGQKPQGQKPQGPPQGQPRGERPPRPERGPESQGGQQPGQGRKPNQPNPPRKPNPPAASSPPPKDGPALDPQETGAEGDDDEGEDDGPEGADAGPGGEGRPRKRRRRRRGGAARPGGGGGGGEGGGAPAP